MKREVIIIWREPPETAWQWKIRIDDEDANVGTATTLTLAAEDCRGWLHEFRKREAIKCPAQIDLEQIGLGKVQPSHNSQIVRCEGTAGHTDSHSASFGAGALVAKVQW